MENNLEKLCERAIDLGATFHDEKIKDKILFAEIENRLGVVLPQDFAYLAKTVELGKLSYCGEIFNLCDYEGVMNGKTIKIANIIDYNLDYRKEYQNLDKVLLLSEDSDVSFLLMFTQDDRQKPTPIVWCDYEDLYNYSETGEFKYKIDKWDSFTDFFEFLIEKEEEAIKEEKELAEAKAKLPPPKKSIWQRLFRK